jgi:hypothetical protein
MVSFRYKTRRDIKMDYNSGKEEITPYRLA